MHLCSALARYMHVDVMHSAYGHTGRDPHSSNQRDNPNSYSQSYENGGTTNMTG